MEVKAEEAQEVLWATTVLEEEVSPITTPDQGQFPLVGLSMEVEDQAATGAGKVPEEEFLGLIGVRITTKQKVKETRRKKQRCLRTINQSLIPMMMGTLVMMLM